jgi:hypothetical protein
MANLIDEKMIKEVYLKYGNWSRPTGGMKGASGSGRKRVCKDVCFICKQPGH